MDHHQPTDDVQPAHDRLPDLTRDEIARVALMELSLWLDEEKAATRDALLNDPEYRAQTRADCERGGLVEWLTVLSWYDLVPEDLAA